MNSTTPDGRVIFIWRGENDTNRLTEAVAEACVAELFNVNGSLVYLNDGQPMAASSRAVVRLIINKHIASVRLVDRDGTLQVEFFSYDFPPGADLNKEPNEATLSSVAEGLLQRAAKGPQVPTRLSPQQQQEIRDRFKIGERADTIADYYHTDIATVRAVAAR